MTRLFCFLLLVALPLSSWAQAYPSKPVRIIVPYATGGMTDTLGRLIAPRLTDRWKQTAIVENRAGGGTIIGTDAASKAAPDGHTLLLTSFGYTTNQILIASLPYDPASLQPQVLVGTAPSMLFVHPGIPAKTVKEVIEYARSRPRQMMFASSGNASSPHIAAELFASMAGIEITHVPYKGTGPAMIDLLGGQVHAIFDNISSMTYAKAGKLRPIAVAHKTRLIGAPEVPTVAESGLPNFTAASWFGFFLQARAPSEIAQKAYADLRAVVEAPEMRERLIQAGLEPAALSREEFSAFLKSELDKWGAIIRARNIRLD